MKKLVYAVIVSLFVFLVLNFFYSNLGSEPFRTEVSFQFGIPYLFTIRSFPVSLGFIVICAFCLGILFLPVLQLVPRIFRTVEIRSKEKRIRQLEKELEEARVTSSVFNGETSDSSGA